MYPARFAWVAVAVLAACGGAAGGAGELGSDLAAGDAADAGWDGSENADGVEEFEAPEALAEAVEPPALLVTRAGAAVTSADRWWQQRQPEIGRLLDHYVYGEAPAPRAVSVGAAAAVEVLGGSVVLEQLEVTVAGAEAWPLHVAVFRPPGAGPFPVWIAPNACGNQTILDDAAIRLTTGWRESQCEGASAEASRGSRAGRFPVAQIVAAGFALVAVHQSDIAPDDAAAGAVGWRDAVRGADGAVASWGVLQAWAYGVAHLARAVPLMTALDGGRVAVVGHSRRGKVALLAGAMEASIGLVVSHQSGTAGARLSRAPVGESVQSITLFFPHWFGPHFAAFAGRETYLPLDQHFLLARVAPRPLLLTNGADDLWAGPEGTRQAAELASPAWELLGEAGLGPDGALDRPLAYHVRDGGHSLGAEDWAVFLEFARGRWPEVTTAP